MATHVYFGFPETKGKRLEEIGQMWEERVPAWRSRSWQPTVPIASDAELARKMEVEHEEDKLMNEDSNPNPEKIKPKWNLVATSILHFFKFIISKYLFCCFQMKN